MAPAGKKRVKTYRSRRDPRRTLSSDRARPLAPSRRCGDRSSHLLRVTWPPQKPPPTCRRPAADLPRPARLRRGAPGTAARRRTGGSAGAPRGRRSEPLWAGRRASEVGRCARSRQRGSCDGWCRLTTVTSRDCRLPTGPDRPAGGPSGRRWRDSTRHNDARRHRPGAHWPETQLLHGQIITLKRCVIS